jgi:hypothetical protein
MRETTQGRQQVLLMKGKVGRPPKKSAPGGSATLTIRIPSEMKNLMVDMAQGYGLSITEYLSTLVRQDASSINGKDS